MAQATGSTPSVTAEGAEEEEVDVPEDEEEATPARHMLPGAINPQTNQTRSIYVTFPCISVLSVQRWGIWPTTA